MRADGRYEMSVYEDRPARIEHVQQAVAKLDAAFPNSFKSEQDKNRFYAVLAEMIADEKMSEQRLTAAIKNTIKTCKTYSQINISDIIGFDCRVKLYTADDVYKERGRFPHPDYTRVKRNGKYFYILTAECEQYGIQEE